jgi:hypothetical protein
MKQPANVKAVSNNEVREAFARRESAHASNFVSTGDKLLSYGWYEIARWFGDTVWIRGGNLYSQTTKSKHMSGLVTLLSIRGIRFKVAPETEFDESDMKLPETWRDYAQNEGSDTYYVLSFDAFDNYRGNVIEQSLTLEQAKWLVDNPQFYHAPDAYEVKMMRLRGE